MRFWSFLSEYLCLREGKRRRETDNDGHGFRHTKGSCHGAYACRKIGEKTNRIIGSPQGCTITRNTEYVRHLTLYFRHFNKRTTYRTPSDHKDNLLHYSLVYHANKIRTFIFLIRKI